MTHVDMPFQTVRGIGHFLVLLYHSVVREIRQADGNAIIGFLMQLAQSIAMIGAFYFMISLFGMRSIAVRGNFILFVMTGVFFFLTHTKTVQKVASAGKSTDPMTLHTPVTTLLLILTSALGLLYNQMITMVIIMFAAHVLIEPITIHYIPGFAFCFFLAWLSGASIGIFFLSLRPFIPRAVSIASLLYRRANMIFSGKMMVANALPSIMLPMFSWNPLFNTIDQARGFTFINYFPHVTSLMYPLYFSIFFIVVGFLMEHWARKYVSSSWEKRSFGT